eukprot:gene2760-12136_t
MGAEVAAGTAKQSSTSGTSTHAECGTSPSRNRMRHLPTPPKARCPRTLRKRRAGDSGDAGDPTAWADTPHA